MPVKRRIAKRRVDPRGEAQAWGSIFDTEYDFFGDLAAWGGVELDEYGRAPRAVAEAAWRRLGAYYLADREPDGRDPWALREFGAPHAR